MADVIAWVIVREDVPGVLSYFTGFASTNNWHTAWSKDPNDAARFPTKGAAWQQVGDGRHFGEGSFVGARAEEHMWCDNPSSVGSRPESPTE